MSRRVVTMRGLSRSVLALLLWTPLALPAAEPPLWRALVELGWHDEFQTDQGWRQEAWLVRAADAQARSRFGPQGAAFEVASGQQAMAWTRTTNPIWVGDFPWLELQYALEGDGEPGDETSGAATLTLGDDSTGPITPGALNPENPLASGGQAELELPPDRHRLVLDVRAAFKPDRVARITLRLRSGTRAARLRVQRLAFWAADPRSGSSAGATAPASASAPPPAPLLHPDDASTPRAAGDWKPLALPEGNTITAEWLAWAYQPGARATGQPSPALGAGQPAVPWPMNAAFQQAGIPFQLGPTERAAAATGVMQTGRLELRGRWRGSALALLLATRVFGSGSPWVGAGSAPGRGAITSPHELLVRLDYDDGTWRSCFPRSLPRGEWAVQRWPEPYVVPLDPDKTLVRIAIEEAMNFGQVFLLAASINQDDAAALPTPAATQPVAPVERVAPAPTPAVARREGDVLEIENAWLRLRARIASGLKLELLTIAPLNRQVVSSAAGGSALLEVWDAQGRRIGLAPGDVRIERSASAASIELTWAMTPGQGSLQARLEITDDGPLLLTPTLVGSSCDLGPITLTCPQVDQCRVSDRPEDRWYLLGTRSTILDHRPIELERAWGGEYPLPLIDVFAPQAGGGLGVFIEDRALVPKVFRFQQDVSGARIAVRFPNLMVPAGKQVRLPTAVLFGHLGDWHDAYRRYHASARAAMGPSGDKRLRDLFYCRRDYPLGGTGYLFDPVARRYTPAALIEESVRGFGGIDMIDISGWAYHEATGRVGDYLSNDLGGLPELRRAVQAAHRRQVKVGLYFEGYLIDRRAPIARQALPAWQMIAREGKPRWWSSEMEFFACPAVREWRQALASAIATAAAETGADAVYVDEFGFAGADKACWSPRHGHPIPSNPLLEEDRMLAAVRRELDQHCPQTAIYIEQMPCDRLVARIDGAFNYGMVGAGLPQHVTRLPLQRFVFPEVASIEMVGHGIRPVAVGEDDLQRCVFHGLAMWLKGRSDSWYSPGFRQVAGRAYRILHGHAETFHSPECEPLVPTLLSDVYANRFVTSAEIIVTVYNGGHTDVAGDLLRTPLPAGWQVRDLWQDRPAEFRRDEGYAVLRGQIEPQGVGVFLLAPGGPPPTSE